ncbi:MAG: histidine phosphatase family protein [Chloroflexota bacterium]
MEHTKQTVWIARHGTREDFLDAGWRQRAERPFDPGLAPVGHQQAKELAQHLQSLPVQQIFVSPFYRTLQTASYAASLLGLPMQPEWGISEHLLKITSQPDIITPAEAAEMFDCLANDYESAVFPQYPESTDAACKRAAMAVQVLADRFPTQNLLFVSHATPTIGMVRNLANIPRRIKAPLCSLFTLQREQDGDWELVVEADISFLSDQTTSLRHAWAF